MNFLGQMTNFN